MMVDRYSVSAARERTGWDISNAAEAKVAVWLHRAGLAAGAKYQHRVESMRLDFAWPDLLVALEVDGPMHFAPHQAAFDRLRDHRLRALGWLVLHIDADAEDADALADQAVRVCQVIHALRAGSASAGRHDTRATIANDKTKGIDDGNDI